MTQLPDISSLRTRGLDAALRAIGFVLWFSFILFCVGLNQSHWALPARTTPFLPLPRSLWQAASDMPRRSQFFLKKLRILSYSLPLDGIGSYVDCSLRDRFQNLRKE